MTLLNISTCTCQCNSIYKCMQKSINSVSLKVKLYSINKSHTDNNNSNLVVGGEKLLYMHDENVT